VTAFGGSYASLLKTGTLSVRKPVHSVTLPLNCWEDSQSDKPAGPLPIGLKLPSETDVGIAESEAEKMAERGNHVEYDEKIKAYNRALICELVARCSTLAADVTAPFWEMGALDVGRRLTSDGVQRLWQELEVIRTASDASMPEIDPVEGFAHLLAIWERGIAWDHLPREEQKKCFRLLEFVRQTLAEGEAIAERAGIPLVAG